MHLLLLYKIHRLNPFSQSWGYKIFVLLGESSVHKCTVHSKGIIKQWNPHDKPNDMLYLWSWISGNSPSVSTLSFIFTIIRCLHSYLLLIIDTSYKLFTVLVFYSCHNKLPHIQQLTQNKFSVLHFCRSDLRMSAGLFFSEYSKEESVSLPFPGSRDHLHPLGWLLLPSSAKPASWDVLDPPSIVTYSSNASQERFLL